MILNYNFLLMYLRTRFPLMFRFSLQFNYVALKLKCFSKCKIGVRKARTEL